MSSSLLSLPIAALHRDTEKKTETGLNFVSVTHLHDTDSQDDWNFNQQPGSLNCRPLLL